MYTYFVCVEKSGPALAMRPVIYYFVRMRVGRNLSAMAQTLLLLPLLLVVEVQCQTYPNVSFMGQTLADHSYVDISQVGRDGSGSDTVQCHTDLYTCCAGAQGIHRGDWYFPNGDRLPFPSDSNPLPIFESRQAQRIDLRRSSGTGPTGIYWCDIETDAVHGNGMRETIYVGLYTSNGGKTILQKHTISFIAQ